MEIDSENFSQMMMNCFEDVKMFARPEYKIRRRRTKTEMRALSTEQRDAIRKAHNRESSQLLRTRRKAKNEEQLTRLGDLESKLIEVQQENKILETEFSGKIGDLENSKEQISIEVNIRMSGKWWELTETAENLQSEIGQISTTYLHADASRKSTIAAQKCRKNQLLKIAELEISALNLEIEIEKEREVQKFMKSLVDSTGDEEEKPAKIEEFITIAQPKTEQSSFSRIEHQRLLNQKYRRDSDERKKRRNSEIQISIENLESELENVREKNREVVESGDVEILKAWFSRREEISGEVKKREMSKLEDLEKNLLTWQQRHLENELRKSQIAAKTYRPQLCRTVKEIESAKMEIRAKHLEIEVEVEKTMNSEFWKI